VVAPMAAGAGPPAAGATKTMPAYGDGWPSPSAERQADPRAVHASSLPPSSERLCRPAMRKASDFPTRAAPLLSTGQAGRLSLPACAEEVVEYADPSERRSLSAQQAAEPRSRPALTANLDSLKQAA